MSKQEKIKAQEPQPQAPETFVQQLERMGAVTVNVSDVKLTRTTQEEDIQGVEYIYIAVRDAKKSQETGKIEFINPHRNRKNLANKLLLVIEISNSIYPPEYINLILKKPAIKVTKKVKEAYLRSSDPWEFLFTYVLNPFKVAHREPEKPGKFKKAGHLVDQQLKYSYPKDQTPQLSIFDVLEDGTKKDIEIAGVEVSEIVEGIKLSPPETKVIDCLCKLLHHNSQTSDPQKEDYYSGNIGYELVQYGGDNTPAPKLAFTLYELTKEYKGGEAISGKDVENVKQILTELDNKRFLLSYIETAHKKGGGRIERKIEDFRKLIHIIQISQTEYSKENIELSKKEETVVLLNPIFRRQIDSKFILYPDDITRRTIIAYGSHNLSEITLRLREYLLRERSSKRYEPKISQDKLYYLLAEKWMRESRRKKVKEYTDKALETVKALGLLLSYEIKPGSTTGEPVIHFRINKDWE
jgi:hypothetical protein